MNKMARRILKCSEQTPPSPTTNTPPPRDRSTASRGTERYNDYYSTRAADTSTWTVSPIDITSPDVSLDMEVTVDGVDLQGGNKMILTFRASASNVSLHYVFSIWDEEDSIWRPLNNHTAFNPASPGDLTNFYSAELVPAAASTLYTYQFEVFDGYFADTTTAPGTAITTELGDFIDSGGDVKLRVSSNDDPGTAVWFLNWDFAQIEVGIDPGYAPSAVNKTTGGSWSRYCSDVFTSDNAAAGTSNTNSLTMPSSGNAVNIDFTFSGIEPPYTGANTLLLWMENATSVANLSGDVKVYFWNYTTPGWEGTAVSSGDASSTTLNQNLIWMFSTPITDHISTSGDTREAKVKIEASHSASFNLYVDWMKLVVGSVNDGTQQSNVSVGSASGNLSDAGNVDSTAASPAVWTLTSSNTYTNQFSGDTNSTYSVAADFSAPATKPSGSAITGIQRASRTNNSSATPVTPIGIRDYAGGWSDFQTRAAGTAYVQHPYVVSGNPYRYPVWGSFGYASAATTAVDTAFGSNPEDSLDTTNNLIGMKIRTTTGLTSSFTVAVDFSFVSIRYVETGAVLEVQFTPEDGTVNTGTSSAGSWRFTKQADATATPWTITNSGSGDGVDVQLEFQNVTLPATYNRLILNTKYAWSVANSTHNVQIYDWTNTTWRPLGGHAQATTDYQLNSSGTASVYQFYQFEVYDGYFRDATGAPGAAISTPVANFVGTGGDAGKVRIKYVRGTTTSNLSIDWAQIEVAQDNAYYLTSATHTVGTSPARFYNDTHYPDNTVASGTGVHNYSLAITKAGSGTARLDTKLDFENVDTPYTGANAILIDYSAATSVLNEPVTLQIWNTSTSGWDTLNAGNLQGGTASRYERWQFVRAVSNWGYYIDSANNDRVRLRFYTEDTTDLTYYLDYVRITLGSVTTSGEVGDVNWGTSFLNDKLATAAMDGTQLPSLAANTGNGWYVNTDRTGIRSSDGTSGVSAFMSFPVTRPANSFVTGIRWAIRAQAAAAITLQAQTRDRSANYAALTNAQYSGWSGAAAASNNLGYAPTAADIITIASASQVLISGLYQTNPSDAVNTTDDRVRLALRTTASTTLIEQSLIWDAAFVSVRYVTP